MKAFLNNRIALTAVLVAIASAAVAVCIYTYANNYNGPPIRSDGFGYYAYLPAIFIHHDIFFTFIDRSDMWPDLARYHLDGPSYTGLGAVADGYVQKYPVGVALLQAPFFFAAWLVAWLSGSDVSGFEPSFQVANAVSGVVYLSLGSWLLFLTLEKIVDGIWAAALVVFAIFTTNLLLYGSYDACFSHVYSFFAASLTLFLLIVQRPRLRPIPFYFLIGAIIGLACIVRPTNAIWTIVLLVSPPQRPREMFAAGFAFLAGAVLMALPQMAYWLASSGNLITYSYRDEGFRFLAPEIWNYLFSARKGMFFWHPAYLLLAITTAFAASRGNSIAVACLGVFAVSCYVNASWWSWWFGGSFGSRPTVDILPFLTVGAGLAMKNIQPTRSRLGIAALVGAALAVPNLIQMNGYIVGTIPFDGMTLDGYAMFWRSVLGVNG